MAWVVCLRFVVYGVGRVWGVGYRVQGWGVGCRSYGAGLTVYGEGFSGLWFRVDGSVVYGLG